MVGSSKSVIVTGGSSGIGLDIVKYYAKNNFKVLATARKLRQELHQMIKDFPEQIQFFEMNVTNRNDHVKAAKTMLNWSNKLDIYINCAGVSQWKPIDEVDENFWDLLLRTNLEGTFWGCQAAADNMPNGGNIINISSLAGKRGSANNSVYCASKFGVNGLTQALAKELGGRQIRVNAVCPVYILTETLKESLKSKNSPTQGQSLDAYIDSFSQTQAALKRMPRGEEVASLCYFLTSDEASAITGQCINVDCGVLPQ